MPAIDPTRHSFWEKALHDLAAEERTLLQENTNQISPTDLGTTFFNSLIVATMKKEQECQEKRWKFKIGKWEICLNDTARKITIWLS